MEMEFKHFIHTAVSFGEVCTGISRGDFAHCHQHHGSGCSGVEGTPSRYGWLGYDKAAR